MPFAIDTPILSPVYDPGPQLTATASTGIAWLSAKLRASSTKGPRVTACAGPSVSILEKIEAPSWLTATEQTSVEVSMFRMQDNLFTIYNLQFTIY